MKRRAELVPLSREHNRALHLARTARRAASADDEAATERAWNDLARAYREEMQAHFAIEERLVLPLLERVGTPAEAARLRREHQAMRGCIESPARWSRERLAVLAEVLRDHVRWEEREIYPLVERHASPSLLAALAAHGAAPPAR